jgi:hypothetical protein
MHVLVNLNGRLYVNNVDEGFDRPSACALGNHPRFYHTIIFSVLLHAVTRPNRPPQKALAPGREMVQIHTCQCTCSCGCRTPTHIYAAVWLAQLKVLEAEIQDTCSALQGVPCIAAALVEALRSATLCRSSSSFGMRLAARWGLLFVPEGLHGG